MGLDHEAIYKAYAGTVVSIDDSAGAFDASGNSVSLDQSKIDSARATLNAEAAATSISTSKNRRSWYNRYYLSINRRSIRQSL